MSQSYLDLAVAYYTAMSHKNLEEVAQHLHPDVEFLGPLAELQGKEALLLAISGFINAFNMLTIRAKFGDGNHAILIYDVEFPLPIGKSRGVSFMTFKEGLISRVELFYDARPFETKKDEIFASSK